MMLSSSLSLQTATRRLVTLALRSSRHHHPRPWHQYASVCQFSTMSLIKELRAASGAPIVDCKKALSNSDNDLKAALDWLREHGAAKVSSKVADREAREGLVAIALTAQHKAASLVAVSSETDFAGRSQTFVDLVEFCAQAALLQTNDTTAEPLVQVLQNDSTVESAMSDAMVAIRENLSLSHATKVTASPEGGVVVGYVHGRILPSQAGTAAALVSLAPLDNNNNKDTDKMLETGKKLAMHIVAAKPQYLDSTSIPDDIVEAERDLLAKQIADSGKPPAIVQKIVNGRLHKFYATTCLLQQSHMIEEGNPQIQKHLTSMGMKLLHYELLSVVN
ncbi:factor Ts [Seminavis robusta]|uniref:Elongation factor Ts, mitochondrial n=1 Tax=Seminavis robusta TaxID=568900 RepID=A0A9N8DMB2_9STRA|nr:factor Ts [Seminavis robusta]|eukprot:Sro205_g086090.1 factor Ts (334) ;mRNA; f:3832-4833